MDFPSADVNHVCREIGAVAQFLELISKELGSPLSVPDEQSFRSSMQQLLNSYVWDADQPRHITYDSAGPRGPAIILSDMLILILATADKSHLPLQRALYERIQQLCAMTTSESTDGPHASSSIR